MYAAYITTLGEPRKHSNADRLQCFSVFSNNVITDLSYHEGQKVIFFPVDGQLSLEFAERNNLIRKKDENGNNIGGYLDPDKRNILAINLRGEKSEGLVLPVEMLSPYTDVSKLERGHKIDVLNGTEICKKYIPVGKKTPATSTNIKTRKSKKELKEKISYPYFDEHIDTPQLGFNQSAFRQGDTCYITLKMHGTSARTMNAVEEKKTKTNFILRKFGIKFKIKRRYQVVSGTRRTTLRNYAGGWYGSNQFRQQYHDFFKDRLPKGVEIFYEIVGWVNESKPIMGRCPNNRVKDKAFSKQYGDETVFTYGCQDGKNDCYVYRMTMKNEDGYSVEIPWEQVQVECEKMGVKCVPTLDKFTYTTWEDLMARVEKFYDGVDPIGKTHIREGIVIRIDNRPSFTAFKHKNFYFKCIEGIIKDESDTPDMEEAEEVLADEG